MWDDVSKGMQVTMETSESLESVGDFADRPLAQYLDSLPVVEPELFSSYLESLQSSIAKQIEELQEAVAPLTGAPTLNEIDQFSVLGGPLQALDVVGMGINGHIGSLIRSISDDPYINSVCEPVGFSSANLYGAGPIVQGSPYLSSQGMLSEIELKSGVPNDVILGIPELGGITSLLGCNKVLAGARFKDSYLSDLQESVLDYYTEGLRHLGGISAAVPPESIRLPNWHNYQASFGITPNVDLKKLGARHGTQFMVKQVLAFEAVARTAERLLSMRDRRKISSKLGYICWAASFGSKILVLYAGQLRILWLLLDKDLLETQTLCGERLRRYVKCLSPPPVQPLIRLPKVKPNAPNIAA